MPCDTRLLTFKEMLKVATEQMSASELRSAECRTQLERARANVHAAQVSLDQAIFDEAQARQAYIDWRNYLNTLPSDCSPSMREKSTGLFNAHVKAELGTLSARETVSSSEKTLNEATADVTFAQDAQRKIAEERKLVASEISKLSRPSR
jgi:hypothetical protein